MCDIGGVTYDKDAVYVNVPGTFARENGDGVWFFTLHLAYV